MKATPRGSSASRLRAALEMYRMGESMMRLRLRRRYPRASEARLAARLVAWLEERPGAEEGDAQGS
ncbi:MAG: hypothetical protein HY720_02390 [Planctomycetes bacterium]|nr:hypothetical protein [Planctomycetota bacterium]